MSKLTFWQNFHTRRAWLSRCAAAMAGCGFSFRQTKGNAHAEDEIRQRVRAHRPEMRWIENESIRLGVDLNLGGAITWLSTTQHPENMVNNWDWGRQIQMSFYAGPAKFRVEGKEVAPAWADFPWNPVQAGDHFGNASKTIAFEQDKHSLKVTAIPMQWSLNNAPCECQIVSVIQLDGHQVRMINQLENQREDATFYPARDQELPAVYLTGNFNRLISYRGQAPWTHEAWEEIEHHPQPGEFPWLRLYGSEGWIALVDQAGYGCGLWQSNNPTFLGGIADHRSVKARRESPQSGVGTYDFPTGYLASVRPEHLEAGKSYVYETRLVLGSIDEIRTSIAKLADQSGLPHWSFEKDRQGWTWQGSESAIHACQRLPEGKEVLSGVVTCGAVHLVSPPCVWQLAKSRRLKASLQLDSTQPVRLNLYWQHPGDREFVPGQMVSTIYGKVNESQNQTESSGFEQIEWELPDTNGIAEKSLVSRLRISFAPTDRSIQLPVKIQSIRAMTIQ
ncbi:hypothetical protein [Planctopirus hydrillae]|nr:hypothetical protein [Planctopirus hydrillae]